MSKEKVKTQPKRTQPKKRKFPTMLDWGLVGLLVLALAGGIFAYLHVHGTEIEIYSLNGEISAASPSSIQAQNYITPAYVARILDKADKSPSVKAIIFEINSPGGSIWASEEILQEIKRAEKPVIVVMGETVASGGYYISTGADWIIAQPMTLTGSIGVIATIPDISGLLDKIGIKIDYIYEGRYKIIYDGARDLTPEERKVISDMIHEAYNYFVNTVAENRHLDRAKVEELATGQLYTGETAYRLGLVDQLGDISTAVKKAVELTGADPTKVKDRRPDRSGLVPKVSGFIGQILTYIEQSPSIEVLYR